MRARAPVIVVGREFLGVRDDESSAKLVEHAPHQQNGVAAESRTQAGDGRGGAAEGAGDLPMGRARDQSRCDRLEQFRSFQSVDRREAALGEAALTSRTTKTRDATIRLALGPVVAIPSGPVRCASSTRTARSIASANAGAARRSSDLPTRAVRKASIAWFDKHLAGGDADRDLIN